jgi:hypothetical protein
MPQQKPVVVAELFFGREITGRPKLTDREWEEFTARVVTPNFPDGFTVFDGEGQWRNPQTGAIGHDATKILLVAAEPSIDLAPRLNAVMEAFKARFRQVSVGLITTPSCAAF